MEIKSESTPNVCCKHSRLSSIGLCCHTMSCKTSSETPHKHRTGNEPADLHRTLSGNMKLTTLHWLLLVPLFAILLLDVCNGLVVARPLLDKDVDNMTDFGERRVATSPFKSSTWENATVPYVFEKGLPLRMQRQAVKAMCAWMKQTNCIKFVERTDEKNFIRYQYSITGECLSFVGRINSQLFYTTGQPVLLTLSCNRGHIMHELGHALGFYHEHERTDRDQHILVLTDNVLPKQLERFEIQSNAIALSAPYDYGSVMHFTLYEHTRNGLKTLHPLTSYEGVIGQRKRLSHIDKASINDIYPCLDIGANDGMLPTNADFIKDGNWITLSPTGVVDYHRKRLVCDVHNCTLSECAGRLFKYHDATDCPDNLISIGKISGSVDDKIIRSGDTVSIRWETSTVNGRTLAPLYCTNNDTRCSLAGKCGGQEPCHQQIFTIKTRAPGNSSEDVVKHNDEISLQQIHTNDAAPIYALSCAQNVTCTITLCKIGSVDDCNRLDLWFLVQKF